jgi:large subunit ribosomal protein L1
MRLGVDPRKADQMVRGTVNLPHGTGKTARVIVFADGEKAAEAEAAGADASAATTSSSASRAGFLDFDAAVATPDQMGKVGKIARILGPRGLMPNPKTGTVTADVTKAVSDIKGGKVNFRVDKQANLHLVIGKAPSTRAAGRELRRRARRDLRAKPASSKGTYLRKVAVSTTMGPGITVDGSAPATSWRTAASRRPRPVPPDPAPGAGSGTLVHSPRPPVAAPPLTEVRVVEGPATCGRPAQVTRTDPDDAPPHAGATRPPDAPCASAPGRLS